MTHPSALATRWPAVHWRSRLAAAAGEKNQRVWYFAQRAPPPPSKRPPRPLSPRTLPPRSMDVDHLLSTEATNAVGSVGAIMRGNPKEGQGEVMLATPGETLQAIIPRLSKVRITCGTTRGRP
jgi:hypothetical protein